MTRRSLAALRRHFFSRPEWEKVGQVPNVVFVEDSCAMEGAAFYYGGADKNVVWPLLWHADRYLHMSLEFTQCSTPAIRVFPIRASTSGFHRRRLRHAPCQRSRISFKKGASNRRNTPPNTMTRFQEIIMLQANRPANPGFPDHFYAAGLSQHRPSQPSRAHAFAFSLANSRSSDFGYLESF